MWLSLSRSVGLSLILASLAIAACGTPTAQTSQTVTQSKCLKTIDITQTPTDKGEETPSLTADKGAVVFGIKAANFRCEQEVIAEHTLQNQTLTITIRPKDLDPATVARCNCTYDIDGKISGLASGTTYQVELIRQSDNFGGAGEKKSLLKITVTPQ